MNLLGKLRTQAGRHGPKVERGLDKAAEAADTRTRGKYSRQIRTGADRAKQAARRYARGGRGGGPA